MRRAVAALLLACLAAAPALAETFKTPEAALKSLYAAFAKGGDSPDEMPYFSERLRGLYDADAKRTPEGEMGALEFDPVVNGQDYQISKVAVGKPAVDGDTAEVEVRFKNFDDSMRLNYSMVREDGSWKIDDIASPEGEFPWVLSKIFEDAAK